MCGKASLSRASGKTTALASGLSELSELSPAARVRAYRSPWPAIESPPMISPPPMMSRFSRRASWIPRSSTLRSLADARRFVRDRRSPPPETCFPPSPASVRFSKLRLSRMFGIEPERCAARRDRAAALRRFCADSVRSICWAEGERPATRLEALPGREDFGVLRRRPSARSQLVPDD
jgi:hypothetical protein